MLLEILLFLTMYYSKKSEKFKICTSSQCLYTVKNLERNSIAFGTYDFLNEFALGWKLFCSTQKQLKLKYSPSVRAETGPKLFCSRKKPLNLKYSPSGRAETENSENS